MRLKLIFEMLVVFLLVGCSDNNSENQVTFERTIYMFENNAPEVVEELSLQECLSIWKSDTLGCKKLRAEVHWEIIKTQLGVNQSYQELLRVLGKPDNVTKKQGENVLSLTYFLKTDCKGNHILSENDFCMVSINLNRFTQTIEFGGLYCT